VQIVNSVDQIISSDYLVLPGVGAFPDGMKALHSRHLPPAILEFVKTGKPLLGVCLGMQMLLSKGTEHTITPGLDLIAGEVLPLPKSVPGFKVPNINWHSVSEPFPGAWKNTIFHEIPKESYFYFVHSYYAHPKHDENLLGVTQFGDLTFASAIHSNNVMGTQFHPEKKRRDGIEPIVCVSSKIIIKIN
jgi:imidazole glycerol-phosphate synthase subunit HisH